VLKINRGGTKVDGGSRNLRDRNTIGMVQWFSRDGAMAATLK